MVEIGRTFQKYNSKTLHAYSAPQVCYIGIQNYAAFTLLACTTNFLLCEQFVAPGRLRPVNSFFETLHLICLTEF